VESYKTHVILFNVFINVKFHHVKVVNDETIFQSSIVNLCMSIRKSNLLSIEEKHIMLTQAMC